MKRKYEFFIGAEEAPEPYVHKQEHIHELKVRLDKWLWAARFFKTRALARIAIEHGKVLYNNESVNPGKEIQLDATVNIHQGRFRKTVIITGLSTRRKNATEALGLFEEIQQNNIQPLELATDAYQNGEYANESPRKVVRFLRRTFIRNPR